MRNCVDMLNVLLQCATKKRPLHPPSLLPQDNEEDKAKAKYKSLLAEQLAKILVKRGMEKISEYALHCLVFEVAKTTEIDDGTLCPPPEGPPPNYDAPPSSSYTTASSTAAAQPSG